MKLAADGMGPGAVGVSTANNAVISTDMKRKRGMTQVAADITPSDMASHHLWQEPSSTDTTIKDWRQKRQAERFQFHRNIGLFEWEAEKVIRAGGH
jgi:hypothetical protein